MPEVDIDIATPRHRRPRSVRRVVERLFLGTIMSVLAVVLDRRLRRVFAKR